MKANLLFCVLTFAILSSPATISAAITSWTESCPRPDCDCGTFVKNGCYARCESGTCVSRANANVGANCPIELTWSNCRDAASGACDGLCTCGIEATPQQEACFYTCNSNWMDCDNIHNNGCECSTPSNCCGGSGGNTRYYSCTACSGSSCAICGPTSCSSQNCGTNSYCSSGSCSSCPADTGNCDGDASNGCETNTNTNLNNCGSCGNVCPDSYGSCGEPTCSGGSCGNSAYPGGQYSGCTGTTGCVNDGSGENVCTCNGLGACLDTCGNGICDSWETPGSCSYDCNHPPSIASAIPVPFPTIVGELVTFSVNWQDNNPGAGIALKICKTNELTCPAEWCSSLPSITNPGECTYATQASDPASNTFYAFVCDSHLYNSCSQSTSGQFEVNHAPSITSANSDSELLPWKRAKEPITFTMAFQDQDSDAAKIHVCKTNNYDYETNTCLGGNWCDGSDYTGSPGMCTYTPTASDYVANDYFVFAEDEHGLVGQPSSPKVFYVNLPRRIASFTARRVYIAHNEEDNIVVKVMNKHKTNAADIVLELDGPGEFKIMRSNVVPVLENNGQRAIFHGVAPQSNDVIVVNVKSLFPLQGQPYPIVMTATSTTEPFPEADILEVIPYHPPSFSGLSVAAIGILFVIALTIFYNKEK